MLDMCSSDLKILMFFLCLQIHLPRWCFTWDIYSKSFLVHVYFNFFIAKGEFTALKYKCQLEGSEICSLSYGTYFKLLYIFTVSLVGVVCFVSRCGWLSTALQVCKGHKRVQDPKGLRGCWELQTSPSSNFSHWLFAATKSNDELEAIEALWCGVQREVPKLMRKSNRGRLSSPEISVFYVFLLKNVCLMLEGEKTYQVFVGRGPLFLLYHPSVYPAFVRPSIQANEF